MKDLTFIDQDPSEGEIVKILHEFCVDLNDEFYITTIKHYRHDILLMLNSNAERSELYSFIISFLNLQERDYIALGGKLVDIDKAVNRFIDKLLFWHITRRKINKISELDSHPISYFSLNYRNVFPFCFYNEKDEFIDNYFGLHLEDLRFGKTAPINYEEVVKVTHTEFRTPLFYQYKIDDENIVQLLFEFIMHGDLEFLYKDYRSNDFDCIINTAKDLEKVTSKLCQQVISGHARLSTFHGQLHSLSSNEDKSLHFYIYGADKKKEIGEVTLKYKNGYAYLKHDDYQTIALLDAIYEGDASSITDILNLQPYLVNMPLLKQNIRTGVIEIITYPLIEAILFDRLDIVKILIDQKNVALNVTTCSGITPLYAAMLKGNKELSHELMSRGARLTEKYKDSVVDDKSG